MSNVIAPVHRYLAGDIDRAEWLSSASYPRVQLLADSDALLALAEAFGAAAADLWLDGKLDVR